MEIAETQIQTDGRTPDERLLAAHVSRRDEAAFAEIVRRHVDLVFGTALRILGDRSAAEEVTQDVFVLLARKAASLRTGSGLAGWLHRAAVLEARMRQRTDLRRRKREEAAAALGTTMDTPETTEDLPIGILDDALLELAEKDRQTLFLRYFEDRPYRDVARTLGVGEDAAQKRASRALEALATILRRRGAATATAALAARTLEAAALTTAPAHLATAAAVAAAGVSSTALGILVAKLMALTKTQATVAALLLAAAPVGYQWRVAAELRREAAAAARELAVTQAERTRAESAANATRRRLEALSERLADVRSQLRHAGDQVATASSAPDASLYLWSDTATHVRIPKSVAQRLRFSGTIDLPTTPEAAPVRRAMEAVGADGSLAEPLGEALGVTPAEAEAIREAFARTASSLQRQVQAAAYLTNRAPAQFRSEGRVTATLVTPALPDRGAKLRSQLRTALDRILGTQRSELVWQQAESTFENEFNRFGGIERIQTAMLMGTGNVAFWNATREPGGEILSYGNSSGRLDIGTFPVQLQPIVSGWLAEPASQRP